MKADFSNLSTFINLRTDYGFKRIFGNPKNKHLLIKFLKALFGDDMSIDDVEYHDKEQLSADENGKRIIYDIYCTSQNKEHHFILEMQNQYEPPFEDRVLYYTSKVVAGQGAIGWNYNISPVISVVVTGFDFKHMKPALIHDIRLTDVNSGDVLTNKMRMIFLSLKYLGDKKWMECKTEIEKIMFLIKNMDKMSKKSEAYKVRDYRDFFDASETNNMVREDVVAYSDSLQRLHSFEAGVEYARNEARIEGFEEGRAKGLEVGREEGRAEGRAEGYVELVTMMINRGKTDEEIMDFTGLTKLDLEKVRTSLH